jgi:RimJ/RimL family protein N-acetyltransferase
MSKWLDNIELIGEKVKLIPLNSNHANDLVNAASDGELWKLKVTSIPSRNNVDDYINFALSEQKANRSLPFVVIEKTTNTIIGSTRYCNATQEHRRLEIGYTWYAKSHQKTGVNTECKYLLLKHAFETLNAIAVEFRTNWFNLPSRKAIERIGAKQDGILRNHRINPDGGLRDSVVFSITNQEWGSVKQSLENNLNKYKS